MESSQQLMNRKKSDCGRWVTTRVRDIESAQMMNREVTHQKSDKTKIDNIYVM